MKLYESDYVLLEMICVDNKYSLDDIDRKALQRLWVLRDAGLIVIHQAMIPNSMRTSAYAVITNAGRDALVEKQRAENEMRQNIAKEQAEEKRRAAERAEDKRRDFTYFILGLLFGWLLGLVTPLDIINAFKVGIEWAVSFFH